MVSDLLALKQSAPLDYDPMQALAGNAYVTGVDALTPADTARVGGKAANYGVLLRRRLRAKSPMSTLPRSTATSA